MILGARNGTQHIPCVLPMDQYPLLPLEAWSRKYPYDASSGGRDGRGLSPIWLRLEHNCIDWRIIDHRLHRPDLTWCTAEYGSTAKKMGGRNYRIWFLRQ